MEEKIDIESSQALYDDAQKSRDKFDNIIKWILTYIITSSLYILIQNNNFILYSKLYIISFILSFISLFSDLISNYFGIIRDETLSKYEYKNNKYIRIDEHYNTYIYLLNRIYYISFICSVLFTLIFTLYKFIIS